MLGSQVSGFAAAEVDPIFEIERHLTGLAQDALQRQRSKPDFDFPEIFRNLPYEFLLWLFIERRSGRSVTVKAASIFLELPQTTSLRLIDMLSDKNIIISDTDKSDRRRRLIRISPNAEREFLRYFRHNHHKDHQIEIVKSIIGIV